MESLQSVNTQNSVLVFQSCIGYAAQWVNEAGRHIRCLFLVTHFTLNTNNKFTRRSWKAARGMLWKRGNMTTFSYVSSLWLRPNVVQFFCALVTFQTKRYSAREFHESTFSFSSANWNSFYGGFIRCSVVCRSDWGTFSCFIMKTFMKTMKNLLNICWWNGKAQKYWTTYWMSSDSLLRK